MEESVRTIAATWLQTCSHLLVVAVDEDSSRPYVRPEHEPFLETRFRTFDEYLSAASPNSFLNYTRLFPSEFQELYECLASSISHPPNHSGPICAKRRLCMYLRFVGHGSSYQTLSAEFTCGERTISAVVDEVTDAIIRVLLERAFPLITRGDFESIASKTQARYDYPRAIGFIDGKHVAIKKPARSGSEYFNYKKFHSIILLACCDCDYNIIAFDVGAPGRGGDAGVFRTSDIKVGDRVETTTLGTSDTHLLTWIDRSETIFSHSRELSGVGPVQFHFLVDSGFGQDFRLVRPYPNQGDGNRSRMRFNQKHSGARRMIESTFGILRRRFSILQKPIELSPVKASRLVISLMILHNFFARREDALQDVERYPTYNGVLAPLENLTSHGGAASAKVSREKITLHYDLLYG